MMQPNEIRQYCVIVNNGSGCIFQPLDLEYTYILTAKHVIEDDQNILSRLVRFEFRDGQIHEIQVAFDPLVLGENYFPHPAKDIAILKVAKIEGHDKIIRQDDIAYMEQRFSLYGFPNTRRNAGAMADWIRIDNDIRILQTKDNGMCEAELLGNPQHHEIIGQSGGCYVRVTGEHLNLIGIQNRVVEAQEEYRGRVDFTPIRHFDEIINENSDHLSPLLPPVMGCFSFSQPKAFDIYGGIHDADIDMVRRYLKERTQDIVESENTPQGIKTLLNERLLMADCDSGQLQSSALWLAWLELLTILKIANDDDFKIEEIEEIFNSVRLIHTDAAGGMARQFKSIMYSDYQGLVDKGLVLINTPEAPADDDQYIIPPGAVVGSIAAAKREREQERMNIGRGRQTPFDHFTIAHAGSFKRIAIIKKLADYRAINDPVTLLQKLKDEFNAILKP
ncbi:MAG: hypothetical protein JST82_09495 [Bacteroidetes bacterium]|nr:hypothetical protein [Bacteroidota bacterium]